MNADRALFHAIVVLAPFAVFFLLLLPFRVRASSALAALLATCLTWVSWLWIQPYHFAAGVIGILATWGGFLLGKGPTAYPAWARRLMFTQQSAAVYDLMAYQLSLRGNLARRAIPCALIGTWLMAVIHELFWYEGYNAGRLLVLGAASFCYGATLAALLNKRAGIYIDRSQAPPGLATIFGATSKDEPARSRRLELSCRLDKNHAIVFSDILVTPFLDIGLSDRTSLDELFAEGHLEEGTYCLAGYPDRGPRAIMKIGFTNDLSIYEGDVDRTAAEEALYIDTSSGFTGGILDFIQARRDTRTKVAEVWWFHASPDAKQEWHRFMETFAHQMNEQIFFAPLKPSRKVGPLDFRKPASTDLVTVSFELK